MQKIQGLSNIIYGRFKTETACAKALGWPRQRLNKITNGKKVPTVGELNELATILNTPVGDLVDIFLQYESPNRQQKLEA